MNIAISGSHGFIGSAVTETLWGAGHQVTPIVREESAVETGIAWSAETGYVDAAKLEGIEAVVHLAGESIQGRWTPKKKVLIQESRGKGTRVLAEALGQLAKPPRVLACASAV